MTITEHFFGLIQCYSEQGICYFRDFEFNPGFLVLFYFFIAAVIIGFLLATIQLIKQLWWDTPAEPEQLLDSIVSQGEPQ